MKLFLILIIIALLAYSLFSNDQKINNVIYVIVLIILTVYVMNINTNNMEHLTGSISDADLEAIRNVASIYNSGNMTVSNLNITGNLAVQGTTNTGTLNVSGNSSLANWNVRNDRIGIPGRTDFYSYLDNGNKWVRMVDYDTTTISGRFNPQQIIADISCISGICTQ